MAAFPWKRRVPASPSLPGTVLPAASLSAGGGALRVLSWLGPLYSFTVPACLASFCLPPLPNENHESLLQMLQRLGEEGAYFVVQRKLAAVQAGRGEGLGGAAVGWHSTNMDF